MALREKAKKHYADTPLYLVSHQGDHYLYSHRDTLSVTNKFQATTQSFTSFVLIGHCIYLLDKGIVSMYDLTAGTPVRQEKATMIMKRYEMGVAAVFNNYIYTLGGSYHDVKLNKEHSASSICEIYDASKDSWRLGPCFSEEVDMPMAAFIFLRYIYRIGGYQLRHGTPTYYSSSVEQLDIYDEESGWEKLPEFDARIGGCKYGIVTLQVSIDSILIFGGYIQEGTFLWDPYQRKLKDLGLGFKGGRNLQGFVYIVDKKNARAILNESNDNKEWYFKMKNWKAAQEKKNL